MHHKMKQTISSIGIIVLIVLSITACSNGSKKATPTPTPTPVNKTLSTIIFTKTDGTIESFSITTPINSLFNTATSSDFIISNASVVENDIVKYTINGTAPNSTFQP